MFEEAAEILIEVIPQYIKGKLTLKEQNHQAAIYRGPIISGIVKQFLVDTNWSDLDYLIVDLPPGTGDIPLTLAQTIPLI